MPYLDAPTLPAAAGGTPRVRRLLAAGRARTVSADGPGVVSAGFRDEGLDACGARVLTQIEGLERAKARLESRLVEAYAALHTIESQQLERLPATGPVRVRPEQVVTAEIACATGVGAAEVSRRLELALAPRRHRVVRRALRTGSTSLYRALVVVAETRALPDDVLPALEQAVLAPAPDGSVASQRLFRSRLRRLVTAADRRSGDARRCGATAARGVFGRLTQDGMGVITVTAPAERVVGVLERVDALARAARAAGDGRTLDQLRSDLLTDLALFGTTPEAAARPEGHPEARVGDSTHGGTHAVAHRGAHGGAHGGPHGGDGAGGPGSTPRPTCGSRLATAPAALVRIVVPFEVAVGSSDAACELPGHGWVTAAHARRIMTAPGSVWQHLGVDVDTGRALGLSTGRYTPTPAMVEHVRAVDGVCRAPGCEVVAERADLDHLTPWPSGPTHVANLQSLSRGCHRLKTAGAWTVRRDGEASRWVTLTGRTYVTHPKDWREALADPGVEAHAPPDEETPPF